MKNYPVCKELINGLDSELWSECKQIKFSFHYKYLDYIYFTSNICNRTSDIYQSPLILTELFQHNLINVSYLKACYLYQVMMTLHFLNDVANDATSTQKSKITS